MSWRSEAKAFADIHVVFLDTFHTFGKLLHFALLHIFGSRKLLALLIQICLVLGQLIGNLVLAFASIWASGGSGDQN